MLMYYFRCVYNCILKRKDNITKADAHCGNILGASRLEMVLRVQFISRVGESHLDAMANMRHVSDWMQKKHSKAIVYEVFPGVLNENNVGDNFKVDGDGVQAEHVTVDPYMNGDLRGLAYMYCALQPGAKHSCIFGNFYDQNIGDPWVWIFVDRNDPNDEGCADYLQVMKEEVKSYVLAHKCYGVKFSTGTDAAIEDECINF